MRAFEGMLRLGCLYPHINATAVFTGRHPTSTADISPPHFSFMSPCLHPSVIPLKRMLPGAWELKYCAAAQPQPLDKSPKAGQGKTADVSSAAHTVWGFKKIYIYKSRLTQLQIPVASRHRQTSSEQGVSLFISERQIRDTLTPPFLSSSSSSCSQECCSRL